MNHCRLKHKGYAWIRRDDGKPDLFAHFQQLDGNEEWAMFGVVEGVGCNHFCLKLFVIQKSIHLDLIPTQGKLEGIILRQTQSCVQGNLWCFQSCLMSTVNYHRVESLAVFQVFFSSFHLYLKGSSDLDRVGSMVGEQDWLKNGDRVQFAEMMNQRSLAEIHMNRIAKLSHLTVMSIQLQG